MSLNFDSVIEFIKNNLIFSALACAGLIFLSIGLIQLLDHPKSDIQYDSARDSKPEQTQVPSLMVDVSGAVIHPGVYVLNSDARTQDALIAAGGLADNADRVYIEKTVNLAQRVSDGMKIYIPEEGQETVSDQSTGSVSSGVARLININTASITDLDNLPGVGPVTAQKIVAGRPYQDIQDLQSRKIVNNSIFEKIKELVSVY